MTTRFSSSMRLVDTWARRGVTACSSTRDMSGMAGMRGRNGGGVQGVGFLGLPHLDASMPRISSIYSIQRSTSVIWNRVVVSARGKDQNREGSSQRQPVLSNAEKKVLRQKAQRMQDSLVTVNAGDKGLTVNFLSGLFDALKANQLVKVRMGCSRQEKKTKTEEIERILDCVCVHSIGSVIIVFRQRGLSMPHELERLLREDTDVGDDEMIEEDTIEQEGKPANIPDEFKVIGS